MRTAPKGEQQHWRFDPAGNRLPITPGTAADASSQITGHLNPTDRQRAGQRSARESQPRDLHDSRFNSLEGHEQIPGVADGAAPARPEHWSGNRVKHYSNARDGASAGAALHFTHDSRGNRTQSQDTHSQRHTRLGYDAGNQLIGIRIQQPGTEELAHHYRYDAFGRRLAKYVRRGGHTSEVYYYGWDGDRLIHTERYSAGSTAAHITHTIHEPGSFTPLLHLSRQGKAAPTPIEHMLSQASPEIREALQEQLADLDTLAQRMQSRWEAMGMGRDQITQQLQQIQQLQQAQHQALQERADSVQLHYYHCDHLGTPQALLDQQGRVHWAARLDAWGNVLQEFNPGNIYQQIRLPGQHEEEGTGLYYNRHRYYDSRVGVYINQDPIGVFGGLNRTEYVTGTPLIRVDNLGTVWELGASFPADSQDPNSPLNMNTVYCDNENIKINSNNVGRCQEVLGTTLLHEASHMKDIIASNPNICHENKGITQIVSADSNERLKSERTAHELELKMLERALKDPPVGCTMRGIQAEINATRDGLDRVNAGTYPN